MSEIDDKLTFFDVKKWCTILKEWGIIVKNTGFSSLTHLFNIYI